MGTSQSSSGAPSGVPMVPPWTPSSTDVVDDGSQPDATNSTPISPHTENAPRARFGSSRQHLGSYGRTGDGRELRRGVREYVRRGLGGGATATRRLGGTVNRANALYGALGESRNRSSDISRRIDEVLARGGDARRVIEVVIEVACPIDGTQDAEASRESIQDALAELLTRFPNADFQNLTDEQRAFVVERFIAGDVYRRFRLDVGGAIQANAPTVATAMSRLREAKDYIRETIVATFDKLRTEGKSITQTTLMSVVRSAIRETMVVFEGYLE